MIQEKVLSSNRMILGELQRINQRFIREAIKEWDLKGEGSFAQWVRDALIYKWVELARTN